MCVHTVLCVCTLCCVCVHCAVCAYCAVCVHTVLCVCVLQTLRPMATRVDNNLILMSHWALWVVLFIALLLRSNVPEEDGWVHSALFQEYD